MRLQCPLTMPERLTEKTKAMPWASPWNGHNLASWQQTDAMEPKQQAGFVNFARYEGSTKQKNN